MWLSKDEIVKVVDTVEECEGFVCQACGKKAYSDVLLDYMSNRFKEIESAFPSGNRVSRLHLKAKDYAELRKHARDSLDIETSAAMLRSGIMGRLWGADLVVSRAYPRGYLLLTEAEVYV